MSPEYVYIDENGHSLAMTQPLEADDEIICFACGLTMWRKPQPVNVVWAGGKPSDDGRQATDE